LKNEILICALNILGDQEENSTSEWEMSLNKINLFCAESLFGSSSRFNLDEFVIAMRKLRECSIPE
jgi:hypothetical protein